MGFCNCNGLTAYNTGSPSAAKLPKVAASVILLRRTADDGTLNQIAASDLVDGKLPSGYVEERINAVDPSRRWFVARAIDDVEDEVGDPITESRTGGVDSIVDKGVRTFAGVFLGKGVPFLAALESLACGDVGVYYIDSCGALVGQRNASGTALRPLPIASNTLFPRLVPATGETLPKIHVMWNFDKRRQQDALIDYLPESALNLTDGDALELDGLLTVNGSASASTTAGVTVALTTDYGSFGNKQPATGWTAADIVITNLDDGGAVVAIDTMTETSFGSGIYEITYDVAQTATDTLRVSPAVDGTAPAEFFERTGFELVAFEYEV